MRRFRNRQVRLRTPAILKQGDVVRIIAPASPFSRQKMVAGVSILQAFGLRVDFSEDIFAADGYLAGDDYRRAAGLIDAFTCPGVDAVMPVRGGYGCARTCAAAGDVSGFQPRMLIGFSDITALHCFLADRADLMTFHGPNVTTLPQLGPDMLEQYRRTLFGIDPGRNFRFAGLEPVADGRVRGRVLAANLTVLMSLAGTDLMPDLEDRVLILEDLNEKPYRLDRMLFQLTRQPGFDKVAGVVFGDFMLQDQELQQFKTLVAGYAARWNIPVATGFPAGHGFINCCVPVGAPAEFDSGSGVLNIENPWADW